MVTSGECCKVVDETANEGLVYMITLSVMYVCVFQSKCTYLADSVVWELLLMFCV